jgi:hypothetical protein
LREDHNGQQAENRGNEQAPSHDVVDTGSAIVFPENRRLSALASYA